MVNNQWSGADFICYPISTNQGTDTYLTHIYSNANNQPDTKDGASYFRDELNVEIRFEVSIVSKTCIPRSFQIEPNYQGNQLATVKMPDSQKPVFVR